MGEIRNSLRFADGLFRNNSHFIPKTILKSKRLSHVVSGHGLPGQMVTRSLNRGCDENVDVGENRLKSVGNNLVVTTRNVEITVWTRPGVTMTTRNTRPNILQVTTEIQHL